MRKLWVLIHSKLKESQTMALLLTLLAGLDASRSVKRLKKYEKAAVSSKNRGFSWHALRDSNP